MNRLDDTSLPADTTACEGHEPTLLALGDDPGAGAIRAESAGRWRVAHALRRLREQINAAFPTRDRTSDGSIGDAAHQSRASDHNPWVRDGGEGIVTAIDITHDVRGGCDADRIVAALVASRDRRIKYIIWNRRIVSASAINGVPPWEWRTYTGRNPHSKHFHLSVLSDKPTYDDAADWTLTRMAESAGDAAIDDDRASLMALAALAGGVDLDAPARPQIVALRDAIRALLDSDPVAWAPANAAPEGGVTREAPTSVETFRDDYERLFATAQVRPERRSVVGWHVAMLKRGRRRYDEVAAATSAPWWFIGIVHMMEASFSFATHLHNGDPLTARTVQVPANRPKAGDPPFDWAFSAIDAIEHDGYARQPDWSLAQALYRFEKYNGFGYRSRNMPSPYLWSFSNHYTKGKFVRDGKFDPDFVSKQCGAAVVLRALVDAGEVTLG